MDTDQMVRQAPKPVKRSQRGRNPMDTRRALKMTLGLVHKEIQRLAPLADRHTLYGAVAPEVVEAAQERDQWREVQRLFERWLEQVDG